MKIILRITTRIQVRKEEAAAYLKVLCQKFFGQTSENCEKLHATCFRCNSDVLLL